MTAKFEHGATRVTGQLVPGTVSNCLADDRVRFKDLAQVALLDGLEEELEAVQGRVADLNPDSFGADTEYVTVEFEKVE